MVHMYVQYVQAPCQSRRFKAVYAMHYLTYATYSVNLSQFDMTATIKPDNNTSCLLWTVPNSVSRL